MEKEITEQQESFRKIVELTDKCAVQSKQILELKQELQDVQGLKVAIQRRTAFLDEREAKCDASGLKALELSNLKVELLDKNKAIDVVKRDLQKALSRLSVLSEEGTREFRELKILYEIQKEQMTDLKYKNKTLLWANEELKEEIEKIKPLAVAG